MGKVRAAESDQEIKLSSYQNEINRLNHVLKQKLEEKDR